MNIFYEFSHTFLFFLLSYVIFLAIFRKFIQKDLQKSSNVLLFGYLIIILPPIIDFIISNGKGFWSFYKFDSLTDLIVRFFTFFGDDPTIGITYGVRVEVFLSLVLLFAYSLIKTKKIKKAVLVSVLSYAVFFILGTIPSWITILTQGFQKGFLIINELHIAQMFFSTTKIFSRETGSLMDALNIKMSIIYATTLPFVLFACFWREFKVKLQAFLKNIRPPQIAYHIGIFCIGMGLATIFTSYEWELELFNLLIILLVSQSIILAWITSVITNDIFDQKIDSISNTTRPLITKTFSTPEYIVIGLLTFTFSIFFASIVSTKIAILLLAYQALATIYSAPPLHLKKFPIIATFVSAVASLIILIIGFILIDPNQSTRLLPSSIQWLLVIALTISLPLKDLKDIRGDRLEKIFTIPAIFGEDKGKTIIASSVFTSFLLCAFFLNEYRLLWWSVIFGGISFWIITFCNNTKHINYKNLNWWLLCVVLLYSLILMTVVFL
ncbi:UbiA family prenyltransferase [Patescibacteria group bacterium]